MTDEDSAFAFDLRSSICGLDRLCRGTIRRKLSNKTMSEEGRESVAQDSQIDQLQAKEHKYATSPYIV